MPEQKPPETPERREKHQGEAGRLAAKAISVRDRLLVLSRHPGQTVAYNALLRRYLQERFLWGLAESVHRDRFVLKGGLRLIGAGFAWARATKDIDLLGSGDPDLARLEAIFQEVCSADAAQRQAADGVRYDPASVQARPIMEEAEYEGVRIVLTASLGTAREPMRIDVGFGDAVTPGPSLMRFPTLLDGTPAPELLAYNDETTAAEKFETMLRRGAVNSRMKDFYDLRRFAQTVAFDGELLSRAIRRTFERRGTIFAPTPVVFTAAFAEDPGKAAQWRAFRRSLGTAGEAAEQFADTAAAVRSLIEPVYSACRDDRPFALRWDPSTGQWRKIGKP